MLLVDPEVQLTVSQSNRVDPAGHINVGGDPAVRPVPTTKFINASSSSCVEPLFTMESLSGFDDAIISALAAIVVPAGASTVTVMSIVAVPQATTSPTVQIPVALL